MKKGADEEEKNMSLAWKTTERNNRKKKPYQLPISSLLKKLLVQACGASCYALRPFPSHVPIYRPLIFSFCIGQAKPSVEAHRFAHGGLDVQGLDILPVFLEQGDEEIDAYIITTVR